MTCGVDYVTRVTITVACLTQLTGNRERQALVDRCAGKRRAGGASQLDRQVVPDERFTTRNQHRLEVPGSGLEQFAPTRGALHQHFPALTEQPEVAATSVGR